MNRFQVAKGREEDFENIWKARDSRLNEMQGFEEFKLLRGPEQEDHTLFSSFTVWSTKENFEAWTKSEQFRSSHRDTGKTKGVFIGHPNFEGFETVDGIS